MSGCDNAPKIASASSTLAIIKDALILRHVPSDLV